jgi:hypothetical protein
MEKQTIVGRNVFGEERKYTFVLMNAELGLEVFHEVVSGLMEFTDDIFSLAPKLKLIASESKGKNKDEVEITPELLELVKYIPKLLTIDKIKYLAKNILPGCVVKIGENEYTTPESGIGEHAKRDPLELYITLFYGLWANYPKYISPLLESLGDVSTQA